MIRLIICLHWYSEGCFKIFAGWKKPARIPAGLIGSPRRRPRRQWRFLGRLDEELWLWVLNYIEEHYDMNFLKRLFVCGDGAAWIKTGLKVLPKSVFVLDMFHLNKRLLGVLGRDSQEYRNAWKAIRVGDRVTVERLLKEVAIFGETPNQIKMAQDCRRYIRSNWDGIMAHRLYPEADLGVSAEGHVSHILSARLSSRPMGWSEKGVDQMSSVTLHISRSRVLQNPLA